MKKDRSITKNWRFYWGTAFLILSCVLPLFGFLVPLLNIPTAVEAVIIAALTIGGPELMIMLAAAFLGKETYQYIKKRIWAFFKKKKKPKPVSPFRYYFGLTLFILSPTLLYFNAYWPEILPQDELWRFYLIISGDFIFVLSFFILGDGFWEKFKKLFVCD